MDIHVFTTDPLFATVVDGIAGAMGHRATQPGSAAPGGLAVVDAARCPLPLDGLLAALDRLRTIVFAPPGTSLPPGVTVAAVHGRSGLARDLPSLIAEYAG